MYGPQSRGVRVIDGVEYTAEEWDRREIRLKLSRIAELLEQINAKLSAYAPSYRAPGGYGGGGGTS